jgi:uncharacterized protein YjiS (DUF1127 family)
MHARRFISLEDSDMRTQQLTLNALRQPREKGWRITAIIRQLRRWRDLYQQRHQLASLSDATLKDIGLSRADVEQEASRPFWDDPLQRR